MAAAKSSNRDAPAATEPAPGCDFEESPLVTCLAIVDSRAYRRPIPGARRRFFRVGQRAARLSQKGDLPSSGE